MPRASVKVLYLKKNNILFFVLDKTIIFVYVHDYVLKLYKPIVSLKA